MPRIEKRGGHWRVRWQPPGAKHSGVSFPSEEEARRHGLGQEPSSCREPSRAASGRAGAAPLEG